ncbi:ATP-binding protein [Limnohabitans sp.]|uniref:sensor histidine kinase n=1 Tax=Limnohabitans sp. TaxID=1907725 RepID=UPI0035B2C4A5
MSAWSRHLYLRIWLAVVLGVAVLMTLVGWAWHVSVEHNAANPPLREWVVRNAQGEVLASTTARPVPGTPLEIQVPMGGPAPMQLFLERRLERPGGGIVHLGGRPPHPRDLSPWWARPPYGFIWMLALMGLAAALALYPVVRRLTKRLEGLQQGVQRWGDGDLSVRMPESGDDEVADLSRRFNAAAERIQNLMAAQKSLLANASHELRSPLARIRMGLELMDTPGAHETVRDRTRHEILRNMTELDQLIDEILLASRLDAREADMGTVERVDLVGLCAEECARVGATLDVPEGMTGLEVQGVSKLLRRMVRNLLENAMRYGAAAGHEDDVVLSLSRENGMPVLRVCDRGPGVPPEYRDRIFEPFFRLPGASERAGGVGLGLALVKSIAERHGWKVQCSDRDGGGACFDIKTP